MTMYAEDLDSFLDNLEFDESDERSRRGGRRNQQPLRTPSPQSSFQPRPSQNYVTQAQLQAAVKTLDGKITTLASNVKTLETRTNSVAAEQDRVAASLRKEIEERKKGSEGIRRDLQQTKTLSVLLPFMTQKVQELPLLDKDGRETGKVKVLTQPDDSMRTMLPFLLLMGGGTSSETSGGGGLMGDNTMMLMMAVMLSDRK